jgi:hypothetical protein
MANKPLNMDQIASIMSQSKGRGPTADPTEPRESVIWFKLDHIIREEGCDNPNCEDIRPSEDRGVNIVAKIKGKHMCRICFLGGWLSETSISTNTSSSNNQ